MRALQGNRIRRNDSSSKLQGRRESKHDKNVRLVSIYLLFKMTSLSIVHSCKADRWSTTDYNESLSFCNSTAHDWHERDIFVYLKLKFNALSLRTLTLTSKLRRQRQRCKEITSAIHSTLIHNLTTIEATVLMLLVLSMPALTRKFP